MGKNLINLIGTISVESQIKMHRKASREENLAGGFKSKNRAHKDKRREENKRACRDFRF